MNSTSAEWSKVKGILSRCIGVYIDYPSDVVCQGYPDAPLLGNGEVGVVVSGDPSSQTLHLHRTDCWEFALGGITITAGAGSSAPSARYEQDLESSEVRANVTINGVATSLKTWVDVDSPLVITELTNDSDKPVEYSIQTWTKSPLLSTGKPCVIWAAPRTLCDDHATLSESEFSYQRNIWPPKEEDAPNYWLLEDAGDESYFITNSKTGRSLGIDGQAVVLGEKGPEVSRWKLNRTYCGYFIENVATGQFISRSDDGICIVDKPERATARWQFDYPDRRFDDEFMGNTGDVCWAQRENSRCTYTTRSTVATRVLGRMAKTNGATAEAMVEPGERIVIVTAVDGSGGLTENVDAMSDVHARACRRVESANTRTVIDMESARIEWWQQFWLKCHIDFKDDLLNSYWYGAFHALACASRPGQYETGLWGPWITTDNPTWGYGNYNNYNHQSPYYGVHSGNRPELLEPYIDGLLHHLPVGQQMAHAAGYPGFIMVRVMGLPGVHGPRRKPGPIAPAPDRDKLPNDQLEVSAFLAINLINHYDYTLDEVFLRERAYPFMIACADFYESYLALENDRYVLYRSGAREGTGEDRNAGYNLAMIEKLFDACLKASRALNVDSERRAKWQHILDHMSDYPTTTANGKAVLREAENRDEVALLNNGVGDNASVLQVIFPADRIGLNSHPELLETARNTIAHMNSDPDRLAWNQGNNFPMIFAQAARVGWDGEALLRQFKDTTRQIFRSNQTAFQYGGGIETSGGTEALHCMLLQSHESEIRLFPVWPHNRDVEFTRLRTHGAFLVSGELKDGEIQYVQIRSEKGGRCTIKNPWPGRSVGANDVHLTGDRLEIPTKANDVILLKPE